MFEFGWLFWVMFFAIFFGCGRMCGWGYRRHLADRWHGDEELPEKKGPTVFVGRVVLDVEERARPEPAKLNRPVESPLKALQRDFVDGRISLDEYENRLDSLELL